jgi:hypothetical protein
MGWVRHVEWMGEARGMYRALVEKPDVNIPLVGRREDNVKMDLKEVGCGGYGQV